MRILLTLLCSIIFLQLSFAQDSLVHVQMDTIQGKVIDAESKEPLMFATIAIFKTGSEVPITGVETDLDGNYSIIIEKGMYDIQISYAGYRSVKVTNISVYDTVVRNIELVAGTTEDYKLIMISGGYEPLIRHDKTTSGRKIDKRDIEKSPIKW